MGVGVEKLADHGCSDRDSGDHHQPSYCRRRGAARGDGGCGQEREKRCAGRADAKTDQAVGEDRYQQTKRKTYFEDSNCHRCHQGADC